MPTLYLAFANHRTQPLESLQEESREVFAKLHPRKMQGHYGIHREEFLELETMAQYLSSYRNDIYLFHFAGHASPDTLLLNDREAGATGIWTMLAQQENLGLVFLSGCATKEQVAFLLDKGVPAVIATSAPINDTRAKNFAIQFYQALADGHTIGEAFDLTRAVNLLIGAPPIVIFHQGVAMPENTQIDPRHWGLFVRDEHGPKWKLPNQPATLNFPTEPNGRSKGVKTIGDTHGFRIGKNYLFAIGINEYQHLPKLFNCVKDVKDFVDLLTQEYQFSKEYVYTIFDESATKENISSNFYWLAETVTPNDNVLIYFSGHGEFDPVLNRGYWIPVDAEQSRITQYIPNSEVQDFLNAIKSHHTFLITDSCFSGSLFVTGGRGRNTGFRRSEKNPSRWGLTSGRDEIVSDGIPGKNSPFSESLLFQLRNNKGTLPVDRLCASVREYVEANSNQTPIGEPLKVKGHKNGMFFFHRNQDKADIWAWESAISEGTQAAYHTYLEKHPRGAYREKAHALIAQLEEVKAWERARALNTISDYNHFKEIYANSPHVIEALAAIEVLEDQRDWELAQSRDTISSYETYKRLHPKGNYIKEADKAIKSILTLENELEAWAQATRLNTIVSYKSYLQDFSNGTWTREATKQIALLEYEGREKEVQERDRQAWEAASKEDCITTYELYRQQFPQGLYYQHALDRLIELKETEEQNDVAYKNEQNAWENAQKLHTIPAYQQYLDAEFNLHEAEAKASIQQLEAIARQEEDEADWNIALQKNSKKAYKQYLRTGHQTHVTEAEESIKRSQASTRRNLKVIGIISGVLFLGAIIWQLWKTGLINAELQRYGGVLFHRLVNGIGLFVSPDLRQHNMVLVKGGTFTMGCTIQQGSRCSYDKKHSVTIDDFYIGQYEVTRKEWQEVMGRYPSYYNNCDDCPVVWASQYDIMKFLRKIKVKTGKNYRLPTEAEWEYAARGGRKGKGYKYAGSNSIDMVAWYYSNSNGAHPVGQKQPNELGLHDMSGNVLEWCRDWYGSYPSSAQKNPKGPFSGSRRVLRGGSCLDSPPNCRVVNRAADYPGKRNGVVGFRLVRTL